MAGFGVGYVYFLFFPPCDLSDTTLYWNDLPNINATDVYSLSLVGDPEEESVEPPVFSNLPSVSTTVNITEGQNITTNPYTIRVKPTSDIGISKVEFYIDDILICTVTSPDENGIYSCDWDTSLYHSDVKVIAYDIDSEQVILNRSATVNLITELANIVEEEVSTSPVGGRAEEATLEEPEEESVVITEENTEEDIEQVKEEPLEIVEEEVKEPFNIFDYWIYILVSLLVIPVVIVLIKGRDNTLKS